MKIAVHNQAGSFSERWIKYLNKNQIRYKIVDCHDSDIIQQLKDCDALLWHHYQNNYRDVLSAKPILFALEHAGIKVFPDFNTAWHFDDKVAQKYLLESIDAPLVPSYVFYDKAKALLWVKETSFPKVFKLKGGAGSTNVKLIHNKNEANKLIRKAFGRGFSQYNRLAYFKDRIRKVKNGQARSIEILKGIGRLILPTEFAKMLGREKGYVYFQDFIPNNDSDIRIIIIGDKAFAIKRMTRDNDFRASGSGEIVYAKEQIDEDCVKIAFEVNDKIKSQSIAYDFVFGENNEPLIVEVSYGFSVAPYDLCPGYWDSNLNWYDGEFNPQSWMIDNLIRQK